MGRLQRYLRSQTCADISRATDKNAGSSGVAYEPTADKLIFRRNSGYCWDNLHVIFYQSDGTVLSEDFPGYLMEPYAYANSAYRIRFDDDEVYHDDNNSGLYGNLCYEITIPKGAAYFRINNGTAFKDSSDDYQNYGMLYTEKKPIHHLEGRKNGGNYWKLTPQSGNTNNLNWQTTNAGLTEWDYNEIVNKAHDQYWDNGNSFTVDSDNDFIYFRKPSGWKDTVYAYFFGGDNLRANNWQRAVYSVWPGLIPAGSSISPNSPETGAYFNQSVKNLQLRVDSVYPVKFYDAAGNRVGQEGNGYVMQYSGKLTYDPNSTNTSGTTTSYPEAAGTYYRVPVPQTAVKFALDNGNSSYNVNRYTERYDILKYSPTKTENGYTKEAYQIFAIQGSGKKQSLKQISPIITAQIQTVMIIRKLLLSDTKTVRTDSMMQGAIISILWHQMQTAGRI